jgi:hypothetical protein
LGTIAECARDLIGKYAPALRSESVPRKDIVIDWLGRALLEANRVGGSFGQTYADCISLAIVARLLASASGLDLSERSRGSSKLAPWRLKRAIDYVEARLDEPVSLAEIASSAGLTRMHFRSAVPRCHGPSPTRVPLAPADRAGSGDARRQVAGGCRAVGRVSNPVTLHERFQALRGATTARVAGVPWAYRSARR